MWDGRDFKLAHVEFEHFVLTFKAHSDYANAGMAGQEHMPFWSLLISSATKP